MAKCLESVVIAVGGLWKTLISGVTRSDLNFILRGRSRSSGGGMAAVIQVGADAGLDWGGDMREGQMPSDA